MRVEGRISRRLTEAILGVFGKEQAK